VDLADERFAVFVPSGSAPPNGYSLMVFVPPWEKAQVPPDWIDPLEKHGMIFVSAANSGNTANILQRRNPLALLGAYNIMQRYRVDPGRVYIGGMSGGSRVALRLALSYPDLFRGAFLHSGSDPIGNLQAPLPSTDLFHKFQESTRLVFFTGQTDIANLYQDEDSRQSLRQWCVFDLYSETIPFIGHELGGGHDFAHAIAALEKHVDVKPEALAKCREHQQKELDAKLHDVRRDIAEGKTDDALSLLKKIDTHYAGLAAPASIDLAHQLSSSP
jgi:dienelactone hydrolase